MLRHILATLIAIIIAFAVLNIALVLVDYPKLDSYPALHIKKLRFPSNTNVNRREGYSRYWVNRFGLVGPEPYPIDDPTVYRIAVFGDSYVEALHVMPEERFSTLIANSIIVSPPYSTVESWNFGFSGDNTGNAYARWVVQAQNIPFHLVVFTFSDQDLSENRPGDVSGPSGAFLRHISGHEFTLDESRIDSRRSEIEWAIKRHFSRFFSSAYEVRLRAKKTYLAKLGQIKTTSLAFADAVAPTPTVSNIVDVPSGAVRDTCDQLRFIYDNVRTAGKSKIVILGLPSAYVVFEEEYRRDRTRRDGYLGIVSCLRKAQVDLVDPLPRLSQSIGVRKDPYSDWDQPGGHFNRVGHQIIAESLTAKLQSVLNEQALVR